MLTPDPYLVQIVLLLCYLPEYLGRTVHVGITANVTE